MRLLKRHSSSALAYLSRKIISLTWILYRTHSEQTISRKGSPLAYSSCSGLKQKHGLVFRFHNPFGLGDAIQDLCFIRELAQQRSDCLFIYHIRPCVSIPLSTLNFSERITLSSYPPLPWQGSINLWRNYFGFYSDYKRHLKYIRSPSYRSFFKYYYQSISDRFRLSFDGFDPSYLAWHANTPYVIPGNTTKPSFFFLNSPALSYQASAESPKKLMELSNYLRGKGYQTDFSTNPDGSHKYSLDELFTKAQQYTVLVAVATGPLFVCVYLGFSEIHAICTEEEVDMFPNVTTHVSCTSLDAYIKSKY